jgi:phosphate/sulfate permease
LVVTAVSGIGEGERYLHAVRALRPRPGERALAWVVTGPIGHLVAGLIDWIALLVRLAWARVRGRSP